jgi:hypothetical protein
VSGRTTPTGFGPSTPLGEDISGQTPGGPFSPVRFEPPSPFRPPGSPQMPGSPVVAPGQSSGSYLELSPQARVSTLLYHAGAPARASRSLPVELSRP